jgi:hypothetical protein
MEYTKDDVPVGYYRYNDGQLVHVMERLGKRVVSFINKDMPIPVSSLPDTAIFTKSPIDSNLEISPEEIQGREEELTAYLLEELTGNLQLTTTRGDKSLCISRQDGKKRFYFLLDIKLDSIEVEEEEEVLNRR